jgi:hypothetical protein
MKPRHTNGTQCEKCLEIFNLYPGAYSPLVGWFMGLQLIVNDAHISECGRGIEKQKLYYKTGASRAKYGQSAHNWNAAIDIFQLKGGKAVYNRKWYEKQICARMEIWIKWYGEPGSKFPELPHFEVCNWRELAKSGELGLVE